MGPYKAQKASERFKIQYFFGISTVSFGEFT